VQVQVQLEACNLHLAASAGGNPSCSSRQSKLQQQERRESLLKLRQQDKTQTLIPNKLTYKVM